MKIAQFIDSDDIGGAESMLVTLSNELVKQGHEIIVFHFANQSIDAACQKHGLTQVHIPFKKLYSSIITIFWFSIVFSRLLRQHKIDILHSHLYGSITGAFLGAFLYRIPHIGTLHDLYMVQERLGRGLMLRMAQFANTRLITVSNDMQAFYESYIPASKALLTIYNGFELSNTINPEGTEFTEVEKADSVRIVTVGRLISLKQQYEELCALTELLKDTPLQLLFVGDGPEFDKIQQKIIAEALQDKVFLLGERTDVFAILKTADIFVLASESEGLSCSIIEAMALGLPAVVSDVGGNRELIKNDTNGFTFKFGDNNAFKEKIKELIDSPKKRKEMGAKSKEIAQTTFSTKIMAKNYINAYQTL